MKYEIMRRVRSEECERKIIFLLGKAPLNIFWNKYRIRALKFIV